MGHLKVFYTEGYNTWIVKEPVEINLDNYPELNGLSKEEIEKYLNQNADKMKSSQGDDADTYSLYDECMEQEDKRVKEYNNEVSFQVEE